MRLGEAGRKHKFYRPNQSNFVVSTPFSPELLGGARQTAWARLHNELAQSRLQRLVPSPFHPHTRLLRDLGELAG